MLGSVEWLKNEKGVSPVIGVILMVAITVIMAATIASFVFGIGSKMTEKAPTMSLEVRVYGDDILVTHLGGEKVEETDLMVVAKQGTRIQRDTSLSFITGGDVDGDGKFGPGDTVIAYLDLDNPRGTWEISIIHKPTGATIWKGTVTV